MTTRMKFSKILSIALGSLFVLAGQDARHAVNAQEHQAEAKTASDAGQQDLADKHSPSLGVLVGPCPGGGVCVIDTIEGSPAERAEIQAGDYILAINDQDVTAPNELKQKISSLESTDTINISIWRRGRFLAKQVALASESKELPRSQRSFLGVMLDGSDRQAGVTIQDVQHKSPADQAGLQSGDRVTQIDGEKIESIDQFTATVQDYEPGAQVKLVIRRGDEEIEKSVVLGEIGQAPMQWFRKSFRMPVDDETFSMPLSPGIGMMDEVIDEMREQIRSLQGEVDELKRRVPPPVSSSLDGVDASPAGAPDDDDLPGEDDLSRTSPASHGASPGTEHDDLSPRFTTLVQFNGRRGFSPNISNDWNGSRYGRRGYLDRNDGFQRNYRPYYGNRGYRSYPYKYYRNGGRSYYYGGRSRYGYRGGVRIGPNFSIWW